MTHPCNPNAQPFFLTTSKVKVEDSDVEQSFLLVYQFPKRKERNSIYRINSKSNKQTGIIVTVRPIFQKDTHQYKLRGNFVDSIKERPGS